MTSDGSRNSSYNEIIKKSGRSRMEGGNSRLRRKLTLIALVDS
jgi:hypothetical protein